MADKRKRYSVKKRLKGGEKLQGMLPPRKARYGKAPAIVPALMGGQSGLIRYGVDKLLNPWIKRKLMLRGQKSPSKKPSASTPSRSPMKGGTQGRSRK